MRSPCPYKQHSGAAKCRPAVLFFRPLLAFNKRETRFDLYPESWTFFKRDSVISGIELDS